MKFSLASPFLLLTANSSNNVGEGGGYATTTMTVSAFTTPPIINKLHHTTDTTRRNKMVVMLSSSNNNTSDGPKKKKVLTAADVMAKSSSAEQQGGGGGSSSDPAAPSASEAPKIFTSEIYNQFQSSLLILEKRISNGSNSLSLNEVTSLNTELNNIINEMKEYNNDPNGSMEMIKKSYNNENDDESGNVVNVMVKKEEPIVPKKSSVITSSTVEPSQEEAIPQTSSSSSSSSPATTEADTMSTFIPPKEQEDLEAEGGLSKGYGLAPGTTNTYAIPGMDEMSPEEYRDKLQETISARQAIRRKEAISSGNIGNRNSSGYLDALSKGGSTDPLRRAGGGEDKAVPSMKPKWQPKKMSAYPKQGESCGDDDDDNHNVDVVSVSSVGASAADGDGNEKETSGMGDNNKVVEGDLSQSGGGVDKNLIQQQNSLPTEAKGHKRTEEWLSQQYNLIKERLVDEQDMLAEREESQRARSISQEEDKTPEVESSSQSSLESVASILEKVPLITSLQTEGAINKMSKEPRTKQDGAKAQSKSTNMESTSLADLVTKNSGGRFNKVSLQSTPTVIDEKRESSSSTKLQMVAQNISEFNEENWWGHQQKRQRPVPSSDRKASFFQVHSSGGASSFVGKATEASQNVSKESTTNFAHGDEANSLRDRSDGSSMGYFRVHTTAKRSASSRSAASLERSSLVETEGRIRPVPSSDLPEYAQRTDHRDIGDSRDPRRTTAQNLGPASLVQSEGRTRPIPSSKVPEYIQVKDRRSQGDMKKTPRKSVSANVSLVESERRSRPVASFKLPVAVKDRRSVGDDHALTKNAKEQTALSSLSGIEQRVRPSPSSGIFQNFQVGDHRGPGDSNAMTKRNKQFVAEASSLSEEEQRSRPSPSSGMFQNFQVGDHRGPGDNNAMTRRATKQHTAASAIPSLSEAEQTVRPTATSSQSQDNFQVSARGVGLTKKAKHQFVKASSLSVDEQRQRPIPSSTQSQPQTIGDYRDASDYSRTTKKAKNYTVSEASSLSVDEQRQRPIPSSGSRPQTMGDYRNVGDYKKTETAVRHQSPESSSSNNNNNDSDQWWNEKTLRPRAQQKHTSAPSSTLPEQPPQSSSKLKSLLNEEQHQLDTNRKTDVKPIAALTPSSLQSLLKEERPIAGSHTEDETNPARGKIPPGLSSLLKDDRHFTPSKRSPVYENRWYDEKQKRPRGYVKHSQPINTSYIKKNEAPRDYGDVVSAQTELDDFEIESTSHDKDDDASRN